MTTAEPTLTAREVIYQAVLDEPADDTPRLVFADWCDDNGEPERAEYVRLAVGAARTRHKHSQKSKCSTCQMLRRCQTLFSANHATFSTDLDGFYGYRQNAVVWEGDEGRRPVISYGSPWNPRFGFWRGFIDTVRWEWAACRYSMKLLLTHAPIQRCVLAMNPWLQLDDPSGVSVAVRKPVYEYATHPALNRWWADPPPQPISLMNTWPQVTEWIIPHWYAPNG